MRAELDRRRTDGAQARAAWSEAAVTLADRGDVHGVLDGAGGQERAPVVDLARPGDPRRRHDDDLGAAVRLANPFELSLAVGGTSIQAVTIEFRQRLFGDFGVALIEGIDRAKRSQVSKFVEVHGDHVRARREGSEQPGDPHPLGERKVAEEPEDRSREVRGVVDRCHPSR